MDKNQSTVPTPHKERGERLRNRREELQRLGRLPDNWDGVFKAFDALAKDMGIKVTISQSGWGMWERGETWPTLKRKAVIAKLMGWTVVQLDHGEGERNEDMSFHPTSGPEVELIALWRGLQAEQKRELIRNLRAAVKANQTLENEVGEGMQFVSNARIEDMYKTPAEMHQRPAKRSKAKSTRKHS